MMNLTKNMMKNTSRMDFYPKSGKASVVEVSSLTHHSMGLMMKEK